MSQQEEAYWDTWFTRLNEQHRKFYEHLRQEGFGLIKGSNVEIFKSKGKELHEQVIEMVELD